MSPGSVHQTLASGEQRRILYYISQKAIKQGYKSCAIKSINAKHLDDLVRGLVLDHLKRAHRVDLADLDPSNRDQRLRRVINRVVVAPEALAIEISTNEVATLAPTTPSKAKRAASAAAAVPTCPFTPTVTVADGVQTLTLPIAIKRHDGRRILVSPDGHDLMVRMNADGRPVPRSHLVSAVGQAFALHRELSRTGHTIERVAARFGMTEARARVLLDITLLSPSILKAALTGTLPATVTLQDLRDAAQHLDWSLQEAALKG